MELQLILNDLSLNPSARDIAHARSCMTDFIFLTVRAVRRGARSVLRVPKGFEAGILSDGYPLARWRNDPEVDLEQRRYFNTVVSKVSYLDGLPVVEDQLALIEYEFDGLAAKGLGVASALDGLALSVKFTDRWNRPLVPLQRQWVETDGDGQILSSLEEVHHASEVDHIEIHSDWIRERLHSGVKDGADVWRRKHELLPGLVFCNRVEGELEVIRSTHVMLKPVYDRLRELDKYARFWEAGPFDPTQLPSNVTPESQGTIEEHETELTFRCPDGKSRLFTWHARMTPGGWRLHFFPDGVNRRIIIGRIGKKPFI
jgi:hypothetical protein